MEALSVLKYWRSNGGAGDGTKNANVTTFTAAGNTTTIVTGVNSQASETGDEEDEENDHGPFFDLEFSIPAEGNEAGAEEHEKNNETDDDDNDDDEDCDGSDDLENETELKLTLLSDSSGDCTADVNISVSPSDELFFKGGFVPVDQTTETNSNSNSKPPQFRLALMKSATKFRVMMLKFRKSKLNAESNESTASNASSCSNSKEEKVDPNGENISNDSGKSMTVKFKIEEVPIVSLFKRRNSSKPPKKRENENETVSGSSSEEKKFSKETMQKYFRKVKPLYVRVSQKYGEKLKLAGVNKPNSVPSSSTTEEQKPVANPKKENESTFEVSEPPLLPINAKGLKQGNIPAGLRVVCKHLGKSWSASTTVAAATAAAPAPGAIPSKRRDDSLIQQQDGIQSAILHCKRSFKASRDSDSSSSLSRSASDPAPATGKCENSSADGGEAEEMKK